MKKQILNEQLSFCTVLESKFPVTKTYKIENGVVVVRAAQMPKNWRAITFELTSLHDLYNILKFVGGEKNKAIIRARGDEDGYESTPRNSDVFNNHSTSWIVFDFDKFEVPDVDRLSPEAIEWLVQNRLPKCFHDVDYVYQWSPSAGLEYESKVIKKGTNCHIFFWMNRSEDGKVLEDWLNSWQKKQSWYPEQKLDTTPLHKSQALYVSSFVQKDGGINDVLVNEDKIKLVSKGRASATVPSHEMMAIMRVKRQFKVDIKVDNTIIQQLSQLGCILRDAGKSLNLWHKGEATKGGWYIYKEKPFFVNHHGQGSMRVEEWVREYWGTELILPQEQAVESLLSGYNKKIVKDNEIVDAIEDASKPLYLLTALEDVKGYYRELIPKLDDYNIIVGHEGVGKSVIAQVLMEQHKKVLFCCASNEQAEKKHKEMSDAGFNVQLITSRAYNLEKKHGVNVNITPPRHSWDPGAIDESETLKTIQEELKVNVGGAEKIWEECKNEDVKWSYDGVVTTHYRANLWCILNYLKNPGNVAKVEKRNKRIQKVPEKVRKVFEMMLISEGEDTNYNERKIPHSTYVIFDDPEGNDFDMLAGYREEFVEVKIFGYDVDTVTLDKGYSYFIKPKMLLPGFVGVNDCKVIFTTTENLIEARIQQLYRGKKMKIEDLKLTFSNVPKIDVGDIIVYATDIVSAKRDGLLIPIIERLRKEGYEFNVIGDGLGLDLNTVNNKGRNDLDDKDLLIEMSVPHPSMAVKMCHELGWEWGSDQRGVNLHMMVDKLNQAIGRNQGYRWQGRKCIVLLPPEYAQDIIGALRYKVKKFERLDALAMNKMGINFKGKSLEERLKWYILYSFRYVMSTEEGGSSGSVFVGDVKNAINNLISDKRTQAKSRIKKALKHLYKENNSNKQFMKIYNSTTSF